MEAVVVAVRVAKEIPEQIIPVILENIREELEHWDKDTPEDTVIMAQGQVGQIREQVKQVAQITVVVVAEAPDQRV
jgi:hypothetical protein